MWRQTSLVPVRSQKYNHIKSVGMTIELPSSISFCCSHHHHRYDDHCYDHCVNRISKFNAASSAFKDLPTQWSCDQSCQRWGPSAYRLAKIKRFCLPCNTLSIFIACFNTSRGTPGISVECHIIGGIHRELRKGILFMPFDDRKWSLHFF